MEKHAGFEQEDKIQQMGIHNYTRLKFLIIGAMNVERGRMKINNYCP